MNFSLGWAVTPMLTSALALAAFAADTTTSTNTWKTEAPVALPATAFKSAKAGPAQPSKYVSLDLLYTPFAKARTAIENRTAKTLSHRGEAHITLITPPEFETLVKVMAPAEIRNLAKTLNSKDVKPVCIGHGVWGANQTWFVVLEYPSAVKYREAVKAAFIKSGGLAADFNAAEFYPHVTLGFEGRDLHLQDGVVKDVSACKYPIY